MIEVYAITAAGEVLKCDTVVIDAEGRHVATFAITAPVTVTAFEVYWQEALIYRTPPGDPPNVGALHGDRVTFAFRLKNVLQLQN